MFELTNYACHATNGCGWANIFGCDLCDQRGSVGGLQTDYFGYWQLGIAHLTDHLLFIAAPNFFRKNQADPCDFAHGSLQSFGCEYILETDVDDLRCDLPRTLDFAFISPSTCTIACTFPGTITIAPIFP
jgi:hypothetical protein